MPGRTIAIGDIHGCATALAALIEAIDPAPDDVLVTLGDYVDRGTESRAAIDLLLQLAERCRLVPLLGNHEEMLMAAYEDPQSPALAAWLQSGGHATLESYGFSSGAMELPAEHLAFISGCRDWHETETHLFLHASYDENLPMEQLSPHQLRWESLRDRVPLRHYSGKTAIVGHTAQKTGEILDRGYLKCIDTYCYGGGLLTALDVDTGHLWQADRTGVIR